VNLQFDLKEKDVQIASLSGFDVDLVNGLYDGFK
jgi:hypothetical protein